MAKASFGKRKQVLDSALEAVKNSTAGAAEVKDWDRVMEALLKEIPKVWSRSTGRIIDNIVATEGKTAEPIERLFAILRSKAGTDGQAAITAAKNAFDAGNTEDTVAFLKGAIKKGSAKERGVLEVASKDPVIGPALRKNNRRGRPSKSGKPTAPAPEPAVVGPAKGPEPTAPIDETPEPAKGPPTASFKPKVRLSPSTGTVESRPPGYDPELAKGPPPDVPPPGTPSVPPSPAATAPAAAAPAAAEVLANPAMKKGAFWPLLSALLGFGEPQGAARETAAGSVGAKGAALTQKALGKYMKLGGVGKFAAGAGTYALLGMLLKGLVGGAVSTAEDESGADISATSKLDTRLRELQTRDADTMMASLLAQRYRDQQAQKAMAAQGPGLLQQLRLQQSLQQGRVPGDQPIGAASLASMGISDY